MADNKIRYNMTTTIGYKLFHYAQKKIFLSEPDNWFRGHLPLCNKESANEIIYHAIDTTTPFMVARLGSTEMKPTLYYSTLVKNSIVKNMLLYLKGDIDYIFNKKDYFTRMSSTMLSHSGFFCINKEDSLKVFAQRMEEYIAEMDLCGAWLNEYILKDKFSKKAQFCKLEDLEPYDYDKPWSQALKGKRVLVIHPFAESIKAQYARKDSIWPDKEVLPDFELITIKAVQSLGGAETPYKDWFEALEAMEAQMDIIEYDVALTGCGAYGLPLAAHAKKTGHIGIHLGGPLQILFGIKGKRWDNIPEVAKFYNDSWVRPLPEETPECHAAVEDSCYW